MSCLRKGFKANNHREGNCDLGFTRTPLRSVYSTAQPVTEMSLYLVNFWEIVNRFVSKSENTRDGRTSTLFSFPPLLSFTPFLFGISLTLAPVLRSSQAGQLCTHLAVLKDSLNRLLQERGRKGRQVCPSLSTIWLWFGKCIEVIACLIWVIFEVYFSFRNRIILCLLPWLILHPISL